MNALLGGGAPEQESSDAFRPSGGHGHGRQGRRDNTNGKEDEPDIASLTPAETAALLLEKNARTGPPAATNNTSRYRTQKVLAHHALAMELADEFAPVISKQPQAQESENDDESDDHEEFLTRRRRPKQEPQIVAARTTKADPKVVPAEPPRRKRRAYQSSSSSSNSESESENDDNGKRPRRGRRKDDGGDDSSSNEDEADQRRQERLAAARRQRAEPQVVVAQTVPQQPEPIATAMTAAPKSATPASNKPSLSGKPKGKDSEESSSEGDSSSDDDSSSSSSEEEQAALLKPLFVPKQKRNLIVSEEVKFQQEEDRHAKEEEREQRRMMESRKMVAQQTAMIQALQHTEEQDEESGGATNAPPNDDDDDDDREHERELWEMRELERLLVALDKQTAKELEKLLYEQRRNMTDAQVLQADIEAGRYQKPGTAREEQQQKGNFMQRFYHRGAYYMDEEEWDDSDVRHKAAEYARAATGEDKIDKSKLPKVMQVKNFGLARQNNRYQGLAKEDTTNKQMETLPLKQPKGMGGRR